MHSNCSLTVIIHTISGGEQIDTLEHWQKEIFFSSIRRSKSILKKSPKIELKFSLYLITYPVDLACKYLSYLNKTPGHWNSSRIAKAGMLGLCLATWPGEQTP